MMNVESTLTRPWPEPTLLLHHRSQRGHDRQGRFFIDQLRVIDLTGGIVEYHDQVVPLIGKPRGLARVDVRHHSRDRPAWLLSAVFASLCCFHQPHQLQRLFDPRVAELDVVFTGPLLLS
jgi:hypothetical protein